MRRPLVAFEIEALAPGHECHVEVGKDAARKEARVEADKTKKAVKNLQQKVEKPTLGDLGALAQIKERLQQQEKGGATASADATPTTPEPEA